MKSKWLNKKVNLREYDAMRKRLKKFKVHTVCEEAKCPNISECFSKDVATFLILGDNCTRQCSFCGVKKGKPCLVDDSEPLRVAAAVRELGLKYVVVTSVTRDDLQDRGADHYANVIKAIKKVKIKDKTNVKVEVLVPDFDGLKTNIKIVQATGPEVIAHNVETVQNLYEKIGRDEYRYEVSLSVLETVKSIDKDQKTKSGIMLGLGETQDQVLKTFNDLREIDCNFLSIGQYLNPTSSHVPVIDYIVPEMFEFYKNQAMKMGFEYVRSGPYVRSSYCADEYIR